MRPLLLLITLATAISAQAQTWQDTSASLDKILSRYPPGAPGAQIAISRNGQTIYSAARGMANLEDSIPLSTSSRIEAGSVSKQFTAACILLLEQQGKLSTNDDIRKYIPEMPDYGYTITIHHLMNHTSGIKDWGAIADVSGWSRGSKAYTNEDALHIICLQKTLNNIPGAEYIYSNSNYNLQAIIIQRISGLSLAEFSKQQIFIPAGMSHTEWRDDYQRIVPHRAIAYGKDNDHYFTNMPNENVYGNGGLLTTAEDLLRWNDYYLGGHLGQPSLLSRQLATTPLNNGRRHPYGAGLIVDSLYGQPIISHSGATAGYRANLEYFPLLRLSIAWLSNNAGDPSSGVPSEIRSLLVDKKRNAKPSPAPTPAPTAASKIPASSFQPWLGAYSDPRTGEGLILSLHPDGIYSLPNGGPLPIVNANTLKAGRERFVFTSANPRLLFHISPSGDSTAYTGVDSARADSASLQEYTGKYYSGETEAHIYIEWKKGGLIMYPRTGAEADLRPIYKDGFSFGEGFVTASRDTAGKVNGIYISVGRARKIAFLKLTN